MTGRNVLVGLSAYEIAKKYKVMHEAPLPTTTPGNIGVKGRT